ncbi:MAG: 2-hydroxyglutaryl-CoA dehydratase [Dehalococcoidales bacterium]|nr:2-hydroxyglutaryl-CoA dehydratase [Dehalococcoidales bacterium]
MPVAGIDIGAGTAKIVILEDNNIITSAVVPVGGNVTKALEEVTDIALDGTGLSVGELEYVVSTGYGRDAASFANYSTTEIICHASGIHFLMPHINTIIDIGAQDSKVIRINGEGKVVNFVMNDKCAAGTGRFLEVMANVLGLELGEMGPAALTSNNPCTISSTCTVFAETEVISLRARGEAVEDLIAGIHRAMASRILIMSSGIRLDQETAFTGGVAKNIGVQKVLEELGDIKCIIPVEPQETGALGAALIAQTRLMETR